ncbi:hypothetical protein [Flavobacterium sp.]|uniref:hypothetical protein n=1 Tax=Flavobacterium sp. TaxID=239 RepID=UPI00262C7794|nr:hypothetical protein [Flavobacterium sp.]
MDKSITLSCKRIHLIILFYCVLLSACTARPQEISLTLVNESSAPIKTFAFYSLSAKKFICGKDLMPQDSIQQVVVFDPTISDVKTGSKAMIIFEINNIHYHIDTGFYEKQKWNSSKDDLAVYITDSGIYYREFKFDEYTGYVYKRSPAVGYFELKTRGKLRKISDCKYEYLDKTAL